MLYNSAFPDLLKVGFSTKDPSLRAKELCGTGVPGKFDVAYEALVENPYDVEQRVHNELGDIRHSGEFFQCSIATAVKAIQKHGQAILLENWLIKDAVFEATDSEYSDVGEPPGGEDDALSQKGGIGAKARRDRPNPRFSRTVRFRGLCASCQKSFEVTLTRHDKGSYCPGCHAWNDLNEYISRELKC